MRGNEERNKEINQKSDFKGISAPNPEDLPGDGGGLGVENADFRGEKGSERREFHWIRGWMEKGQIPFFFPKICPQGAEIPLGKSPREGFGLILFPFHGGRAEILGVYPKKIPLGLRGIQPWDRKKKREKILEKKI